MNPLHDELKRFYEKSDMEEIRKKVDKDFWRLTYHVMPPSGWLNDPNGAMQYDGTYHLYYQYSPHDANGGIKYWGHMTSEDLVNFADQGIALYPDQPYDLHGVYSGTAFIEKDLIHFFYTGNVKYIGEHDYTTSGREQNTIHAVSRDGGKTIEKLGYVIHAKDYPEQFSNHIRDPKIFKVNGHYYMILGARDRDSQGQIIVYRSDDLYQWVYHGIFAGPVENFGFMWECPDYFQLNGEDILVFSPQGLEAKGYAFQNSDQAGYVIGHLDTEKIQFEAKEDFIEFDRGFDFYAPQTFEDEQGRRILWAWMGLPGDNITNPTVEKGWQHAMTMPRQLTIEDGRLRQRPLPEYEKLRDEGIELSIALTNIYQSKQLQGEIFEMIVHFNRIDDELEIYLRQDTTLRYDPEKQLFTLKLGDSGYGRDQRSIEIDSLDQLQIFSDSSSLEIFINDGEYVMTTRLYPEPGQVQIRFKGNGELSIRKWNLIKSKE